MRSHQKQSSRYLRINPIACDGVGICSHLAPDLIAVDSWGYPILTGHPLRPSQQRSAEGAVNGCPRKALFISERYWD